MSRIRARVMGIESFEGVHIVKFGYHDMQISMMSLALEETIMIGAEVVLFINPSHVAIAKVHFEDISYANQLPVTIETITKGRLLSYIKLRFFDTTLESIITLESTNRMTLKEGDVVVALIKASEVSIVEVLDV